MLPFTQLLAYPDEVAILCEAISKHVEGQHPEGMLSCHLAI
jgi:hypothetical protein